MLPEFFQPCPYTKEADEADEAFESLERREPDSPQAFYPCL
jgi:hypothetical protein